LRMQSWSRNVSAGHAAPGRIAALIVSAVLALGFCSRSADGFVAARGAGATTVTGRQGQLPCSGLGQPAADAPSWRPVAIAAVVAAAVFGLRVQRGVRVARSAHSGENAGQAEFGVDFSRRCLVALAGSAYFIGAASASAAEGDEADLPDGVRQEERIRKALKAWKEWPDKLKGDKVEKEEWQNTQGFLRRLYSVNDDMNYLSQGFKIDKKKKAEILITTFKKRVKLADKTAKARDYDAFMADHNDITGFIVEFQDLMLDANDDLVQEGAEEELINVAK